MYLKRLIPFLLGGCLVIAISLSILQGESRGFIIGFALMLLMFAVVPFTILYLKDKLLTKQGLTHKEITTKGVIYLVTPAMVIITLFFGLAGWSLASETGHTTQFLIGLIPGSLLGFVSIYKTVIKKRGANYFRQLRKKNQLVMTIYLSVSLITSLSFFPKKYPPFVSSFYENHPDIFAVLAGAIVSMLFFSTIGGFLLAVRRKEHLAVEA